MTIPAESIIEQQGQAIRRLRSVLIEALVLIENPDSNRYDRADVAEKIKATLGIRPATHHSSPTTRHEARP